MKGLLLIPLVLFWACEDKKDDLLPLDCAGVEGGTAFENECGCVGGSTGFDEDYCYICIDNDGTQYETILIGGQIWMKENLKLIQNGKADVIIAGGVEQISLDLYMIFYMRKMLAKANGTGNEISMPFDKRRSGFTMSEGSYVFVLEGHDYAVSRGARIYGEVSGYGSIFAGGRNSDTGKRVEKAGNAMKKCIDDAGMSTDDIDLINANGNSGKLPDLIEASSIHFFIAFPAFSTLDRKSTRLNSSH